MLLAQYYRTELYMSATISCLNLIDDFLDIYFFCLFSIDASAEDGRFGRLINHSKRHTNLKPQVCAVDASPRLFFTARRRIVAGEELLYD